ncbi:efflux RND transporter permease subunit [Candidatus Saccharibacteria bacterium]|nr:efflux RND transporter permease subunit [Candidatus Saccharibacteria bacterium]
MKNNFLSKISWNFASKYRLTLIIWFGLLIFGFASYSTLLKKEGFPPINLPIGAVQGTYFVNDSTKVDTEITQPIAKALEPIDSIDNYQASTGANFYSIFITFNEETKVEDGVREVQAALNAIKLPTGATSNVASFDPSKFDNKYNLLLAVYDKQDSNYQDLAIKATQVAEELAGADEIVAAQAVPVLETVINPADGQSIEKQTTINKIAINQDGETTFYPAVNVGVVKAEGFDDLELSNAVENVLGDIDNNSQIKTKITADFATTINQQIASLQSSLLWGLFAVIVVTLLLISWRAALVISLFIPTVLAGTFAGLYTMGITLNTITLFAVILTLGLFVDDATIIVEAIDAHRKDSKKSREIIQKAITRVGIASIAGTLTTILVFAPMLFISGILGSFIRLLPVTVILSLGLSLVISVTLVPFLARPIILAGSNRAKLLDKLSLLVPVEKFLAGKLSKLPLLNRDKPKRGRLVTLAMVSLSILAVFGAGIFAGKLPMDVFPQSKDSDILQATVEFAPGTTIEQAEKITDKLDANIITAIGEELTNVSYLSANERNASLEIGLTSYNERKPTSHQLIERLENTGLDIDGATIQYSQRDAGPGAEEFPFQMRIYGQDITLLDSAATEISNFIDEQEFQINGQDLNVAEVTIDEDGSINRTEQGRFITILARFSNPDLSSPAIIDLEQAVKDQFNEAKLKEIGLHQDSLDFDVSQESENTDSFNSIGVGLVIALIMMYFLLVMLYNSFLLPILIFTAIPFSLFGVFFGLTVTDNSLSFFVMLGLLGLIGIVVNNTILLTEYAEQERAGGADRWTAISNAVRDRFRPLVTTTSTTVFALMPLAISDPFWQALAYTLIFGMLSSTILIILAFPYYYLLVARIREWKDRVLPGLR